MQTTRAYVLKTGENLGNSCLFSPVVEMAGTGAREWPNKLQAQGDKGAQATVHWPLISLQPDLEKPVQMVPKSRLPRPWEEKEPPGSWQMVCSTGSAAEPHTLGKWQVPAGILSV